MLPDVKTTGITQMKQQKIGVICEIPVVFIACGVVDMSPVLVVDFVSSRLCDE
jgi:hypothetical protein